MNEKYFEDESKKGFRVVAGLIIKDDEILLTQRWPAKYLGLTWEFPGGKVEPGETDNEALKRELKEELGVEAKIGSCCFETRHGYGNREVHLLIYRCKLLGEPKPIDVKAFEWVARESLSSRNFPPADLLFVQELAAGRISKEDTFEDSAQEIKFTPPKVVRKVNVIKEEK